MFMAPSESAKLELILVYEDCLTVLQAWAEYSLPPALVLDVYLGLKICGWLPGSSGEPL